MAIPSFRTLAFAWTGLAATAAIGATVLQASYVAPPAPAPAPVAAVVPPAPAPAIPAPAPAVPAPVPAAAAVPLPFQNRSLLAMLPPPDVRPRPPAHAALHRLPVPPAPPLRIARLEPPRRVVSVVRRRPAEPVYVADPGYTPFGWGRPLPFPGQYAFSRRFEGGPVVFQGW